MRSKYDGIYYGLGNPGPMVGQLSSHVRRTWIIIAGSLTLNSELHYLTLVELAHGHTCANKLADNPASFVRYCIRSGWLVAQ